MLSLWSAMRVDNDGHLTLLARAVHERANLTIVERLEANEVRRHKLRLVQPTNLGLCPARHLLWHAVFELEGVGILRSVGADKAEPQLALGLASRVEVHLADHARQA
eukprot:1358208-Rhodomonas_salina.1